MNSLQLTLLSLGIVLIAAVLLYNWWQERKIQKEVNENFKADVSSGDPLLGQPIDVAHEPSLGGPTPITEEDEDIPDEFIETVLEIRFVNPVIGQELDPLLKHYPKAIDKNIRYFAQNELNHLNSTIRHDQFYSALLVAVVLANRSGPLGPEHVSALSMIADQIISHFEGDIDVPNWHDVYQRAQQLDKVFASLDAQVGISMLLPQPRPVEEVINVLYQFNYTETRQTVGVLDPASGVPYFVVMFDGLPLNQVASLKVHRLELLIDVPNSPMYDAAFTRLFASAKQLANALPAQIVDDQNQPIDNSDISSAIDRQLYKIYQDLEAQGVPAGSERAALVFS